MKSMDKISTGIAYGTSAGSAGYWFLQLLDRVTPSQWAAIGVLGSLVFGLLTYLTNITKSRCCCYWWRSNCYSISVNHWPKW
ncbi:class II holin family protein [Escherichia coli]